MLSKIYTIGISLGDLTACFTMGQFFPHTLDIGLSTILRVRLANIVPPVNLAELCWKVQRPILGRRQRWARITSLIGGAKEFDEGRAKECSQRNLVTRGYSDGLPWLFDGFRPVYPLSVIVQTSRLGSARTSTGCYVFHATFTAVFSNRERPLLRFPISLWH